MAKLRIGRDMLVRARDRSNLPQHVSRHLPDRPVGC